MYVCVYISMSLRKSTLKGYFLLILRDFFLLVTLKMTLDVFLFYKLCSVYIYNIYIQYSINFSTF